MSAPVARAGCAFLLALATLLNTGCGGGGDGVGAAISASLSGISQHVVTSTESDQPGTDLSDSQRVYEECLLAANGGCFTMNVSVLLSSPPQLFFFTAIGTSFASSPAGNPNGVMTQVGQPMFLIVPPKYTTASSSVFPDASIGRAFVDQGQLYWESSIDPSRVSYVDGGVLSETVTASGPISLSVFTSAVDRIPLTGTLSDAPAEMKASIGFDPAHIIGSATFAPGSVLYRRTTTYVGDHLFVADYDNKPDTDPQSATPAARSMTIEQFAAASPTLLSMSQGEISTIRGARCWVRSAPNVDANGATLRRSSDPTYQAWCELGGNIYKAFLTPDGAQAQSWFPQGGTSLPDNRTRYVLRLNRTAVDSLRNMMF